MTSKDKAAALELAIESLKKQYPKSDEPLTINKPRRFTDPNAQMDYEFWQDMNAGPDWVPRWGGEDNKI